MDKKKRDESGIRIDIPQGTNDEVAVDEVIDDLIHGHTGEALRAMREPSPERPKDDK